MYGLLEVFLIFAVTGAQEMLDTWTGPASSVDGGACRRSPQGGNAGQGLSAIGENL